MKTQSTILLVDDDSAFRGVLQSELSRMNFAVAAAGSGEEALRRIDEVQPDVVLLDLRLPGASGLDVLKVIREKRPAADVIMLTGHGSIDTAIESVRMGAFDYVSKPCPLDDLEIRIRRALERQSLKRRATLLERGLTPADPRHELVGESPAFRQLLDLVERVAASDSSVLILGETGSGKEMIAKLLHARSSRARKPFVVVECAALQENLLQSELFGHERGAFTGADRAKPGLFEVAHGGTLFLDEIGEVSLATQVKLLRVLDSSTFRHVGGTSEIRVDVRVIAATNRDLPGMVRQGLFREDLYYRLSTVTLQVPALRERPSDIALLAEHFVALFNQRFGLSRRIGAEALKMLRAHDWPGNVRELRHAIEAAMVVCDGPELLPQHFSAAIRRPNGSAQPGASSGAHTLREVERVQIKAALESTAGHRAKAAKLLGISERNLYRKIRTYHLDSVTGRP